jgi:hypothetical protein
MERVAFLPIPRDASLTTTIEHLNKQLVPSLATLGKLQRPTPSPLVTVSRALTESDVLVPVDTTAGAVVLSTLRPAREFSGHWFWIKKVAGGNALTFDPMGSETVDGAATLTITTPVVIWSDGANWQSW